MTTPEIISVIGSWKLGGIYTDESSANSRNTLLSILNDSRQAVLFSQVTGGNSIPEVLYQEWDLEYDFVDKCSYIAQCPQVVTLPAPFMNGWDGIYLPCGLSITQAPSLSRLRAYKQHNIYKNIPTAGLFYFNGQYLDISLKPNIDIKGATARAILADPTKANNFSYEKDEYPMPGNYLNLVKMLLEGEWGRRWLKPTDKVSNTVVDTDNQRMP